jgi:transcriptional regulator with GAF, ATPase, and Fis domain
MGHPHLVQDLRLLHPLLKSLADHSQQVVERWYGLYAGRCGENRTLVHATLVAKRYIRTEPASLPLRIETPAGDSPEQDVRRDFHGLLAASLATRRIYDRVEAAGRARGTVLIVGESGTGKELVARAIHQTGPNPDAPFVAVNCPAIPRDLIESELFGHKRGSFSGASVDYLGLFRAAEGGTLLLDEVTEMNLETQSKLLRALQERAVRPVGSVAEVAVNVRVIAPRPIAPPLRPSSSGSCARTCTIGSRPT